ncbi:MAG: NUDIX domain-containing protein, partial [Candidatus Omnitrophica bacterium]|nr:NUDIX domain-containing protein [Candidatus Omnitrophota bacterium]
VSQMLLIREGYTRLADSIGVENGDIAPELSSTLVTRALSIRSTSFFGNFKTLTARFGFEGLPAEGEGPEAGNPAGIDLLQASYINGLGETARAGGFRMKRFLEAADYLRDRGIGWDSPVDAMSRHLLITLLVSLASDVMDESRQGLDLARLDRAFRAVEAALGPASETTEPSARHTWIIRLYTEALNTTAPYARRTFGLGRASGSGTDGASRPRAASTEPRKSGDGRSAKDKPAAQNLTLYSGWAFSHAGVKYSLGKALLKMLHVDPEQAPADGASRQLSVSVERTEGRRPLILIRSMSHPTAQVIELDPENEKPVVFDRIVTPGSGRRDVSVWDVLQNQKEIPGLFITDLVPAVSAPKPPPARVMPPASPTHAASARPVSQSIPTFASEPMPDPTERSEPDFAAIEKMIQERQTFEDVPVVHVLFDKDVRAAASRARIESIVQATLEGRRQIGLARRVWRLPSADSKIDGHFVVEIDPSRADKYSITADDLMTALSFNGDSSRSWLLTRDGWKRSSLMSPTIGGLKGIVVAASGARMAVRSEPNLDASGPAVVIDSKNHQDSGLYSWNLEDDGTETLPGEDIPDAPGQIIVDTGQMVLMDLDRHPDTFLITTGLNRCLAVEIRIGRSDRHGPMIGIAHDYRMVGDTRPILDRVSRIVNELSRAGIDPGLIELSVFHDDEQAPELTSDSSHERVRATGVQAIKFYKRNSLPMEMPSVVVNSKGAYVQRRMTAGDDVRLTLSGARMAEDSRRNRGWIGWTAISVLVIGAAAGLIKNSHGGSLKMRIRVSEEKGRAQVRISKWESQLEEFGIKVDLPDDYVAQWMATQSLKIQLAQNKAAREMGVPLDRLESMMSTDPPARPHIKVLDPDTGERRYFYLDDVASVIDAAKEKSAEILGVDPSRLDVSAEIITDYVRSMSGVVADQPTRVRAIVKYDGKEYTYTLSFNDLTLLETDVVPIKPAGARMAESPGIARLRSEPGVEVIGGGRDGDVASGEEDMVDVVDEAGNLIPGSKPVSQGQVHRDGSWHRTAHVWVFDPEGRVLMQRRSLLKKTSPGKLQVASSGHLNTGESVLDAAVRETEEELGIRFDSSRLIRMSEENEIRRAYRMSDNRANNEFSTVYKVTATPEEMQIIRERYNLKEVEDIWLVPSDTLEKYIREDADLEDVERQIFAKTPHHMLLPEVVHIYRRIMGARMADLQGAPHRIPIIWPERTIRAIQRARLRSHHPSLPNIIRNREYFGYDIVMDREGPTLKELLSSPEVLKISDDSYFRQTISWILQVLEAVIALNGTQHGNLTTNNMIMVRDARGVLKPILIGFDEFDQEDRVAAPGLLSEVLMARELMYAPSEDQDPSKFMAWHTKFTEEYAELDRMSNKAYSTVHEFYAELAFYALEKWGIQPQFFTSVGARMAEVPEAPALGGMDGWVREVIRQWDAFLEGDSSFGQLEWIELPRKRARFLDRIQEMHSTHVRQLAAGKNGMTIEYVEAFRKAAAEVLLFVLLDREFLARWHAVNIDIGIGRLGPGAIMTPFETLREHLKNPDLSAGLYGYPRHRSGVTYDLAHARRHKRVAILTSLLTKAVNHREWHEPDDIGIDGSPEVIQEVAESMRLSTHLANTAEKLRAALKEESSEWLRDTSRLDELLRAAFDQDALALGRAPSPSIVESLLLEMVRYVKYREKQDERARQTRHRIQVAATDDQEPILKSFDFFHRSNGILQRAIPAVTSDEFNQLMNYVFERSEFNYRFLDVYKKSLGQLGARMAASIDSADQSRIDSAAGVAVHNRDQLAGSGMGHEEDYSAGYRDALGEGAGLSDSQLRQKIIVSKRWFDTMHAGWAKAYYEGMIAGFDSLI